MADTSYTYSKSGDFTSGVNSSRLDQEIQDSDIVIGLRGVSVLDDDVTITFKAALDSSDQSLLDGIVSNHDGSPSSPTAAPVEVSKVTAPEKLGVNSFPAEGSRTNFITHNWADETTWYQEAVRVVDEQPTSLDANGKDFQLANSPVIDLSHGRVFDEDYMTDANGHSYAVTVKINGVEIPEGDPDQAFDDSVDDGDWSLNYKTGILTMNPNLGNGDTLEVTYHYATSSKFTIEPKDGKVLKIKQAEVQFSRDVSLRDTIEFSYTGYAAAIDPEGFQNGDYGPDPYTRIPIFDPDRYKRMTDFLSESNGVYPVAPATANNDPTYRDLQSGVVTFPWQYQSVIPVYSSAGMRIEIQLLDDRPYDGSFATATFYCYSEDDPNA